MLDLVQFIILICIYNTVTHRDAHSPASQPSHQLIIDADCLRCDCSCSALSQPWVSDMHVNNNNTLHMLCSIINRPSHPSAHTTVIGGNLGETGG